MAEFEFEGGFSKAWEEKGSKFVTIHNVSDTRIDGDGESMSLDVIKQMVNISKTGKQPDGTVKPPILIDGHRTAFEIGTAVDGRVFKSADGEYCADIDIRLNPDHPLSDTLFKEVLEERCKKQASVHGRVLTKTSREGGKLIITHTDLREFEHIAVTRPGIAAVKGSGFMNAIYKSLEKDLQGDNQMDDTQIKALMDSNKKIEELLGKVIDKEVKRDPAAPTVESLTAQLTTLTKEMGELKAASQTIDPTKVNISETTFAKETTTSIEKIATAVSDLGGMVQVIVKELSKPNARSGQPTLAPGSFIVSKQTGDDDKDKPGKSEKDTLIAEYHSISKECEPLMRLRDRGALDQTGKVQLEMAGEKMLTIKTQLANQYQVTSL